jgi:hypothetical protein
MIEGGKNESHIPKIFSNLLRPYNWKDKNLGAELNVYEIKGKHDKELKAQ